MSESVPSPDPSLVPDAVETYLALIEGMPVMLWTASDDGHWTHVNDRWVTYTGVVGESPGFGFEVAVHPDDRPHTLELWLTAVQDGTPYETEYRIRRQDGRYRWFLVQGRRVARPLGPEVVWIGTCTDIEEQKQAQLAAAATRESAVRALGLALEVRDRETRGHTDRVTALALQLGSALKLDAAQLDALRLGAYLHDIGKIGVPDAVLLKPGPLSDSERTLMCTHVASGVQFALTLGFLPAGALALIGDHHERWDGSGYPQHLRGEAISLLGRIFAVVDVYDALVSERPYKKAWTPEDAREELLAQAGQQFDPDIVRAFLALSPLD